MVTPNLKQPTDSNPGDTAVVGAPDFKKMAQVIMGIEPGGERIQASAIEGLQAPYTATIKPEGSNYVVRSNTGSILHSSTSAHNALQVLLDQAGHLLITGPVGTVYNTTAVRTILSGTILDVSPGITIKGAGDNGTLTDIGGGVMVRQAHPLLRNADHPNATNTGNSVIVVRGGLWDGNVLDTTGAVNNGTTKSTTANLDFWKCDLVWLDRVRSINSQSECIKVRETKNAWITNCYTNHSRLTSDDRIGKAGISGGNISDSVIISNNVCIDSGGEGIGCYYASGSVLMTNNVCKYVSFGRNHILNEGNNATGEHVRNTIISNNRVHAAWYGITVMSTIGAIISENHISTVPMDETFTFEGTIRNEGIRVSGGSDRIKIDNNHIFDTQLHGIMIESQPNNITVTNNTIINPGQRTANAYDGIFFNVAGTATRRNIKIANNLIEDNQGTKTMRYGISFNLGNQEIYNVWCHDNQIYNAQTATINLSFGGTSGRFREDTRFYNNTGFNPFGKITSPFNNTHSEVGIVRSGTASVAASPSTNTEYTVVMSAVAVYVSGGSNLSVTIKDKSGGTSILTNGGTNTVYQLALGQTINFGGFSGSPTFHVVGL